MLRKEPCLKKGKKKKILEPGTGLGQRLLFPRNEESLNCVNERVSQTGDFVHLRGQSSEITQ